MLTLLGFGSSARRGATGWTNRARFRAVLDIAQPDATVDGASPSLGADELFHEAATEHFLARDLLPSLARRCPMEPAKDGHHRGRFMNRNARQYREHRPALAVGGVTGKVGAKLSAGSANMLSICLRGLPGVPPCAVVVLRDNGIEPYTDLDTALGQMRRLYAATKDAHLGNPGAALVALTRGETTAAEVLAVLAALAFAREGSRWAPWIAAVEATVRSARTT